MKRRVTVEIDLKALVRNYRKIVAHVKPMKVLCVLKANAYGLGVAEYAKALYAAGCENFGVAEPHEAMELIRVFSSRDRNVASPLSADLPQRGRDKNVVSPLSVDLSQRGREGGSASSLLVCAQRGRDIPVACVKKTSSAFPSIQILSSILPDEIPEMVRAGVILPITDLASARLISAAAVRAKKIARVHFKLDTGMGRLGILASDPTGVDRALETIRAVRALPNLDCEGIFTHCPMAYEPKDPFTKRQIALFKSILAACAKEGITFKKVHMAASDAINNFPETAKKPFTLVRTGINLHGSFDPYGRKALKVEPVLTLKTRVAQVRELPAGTTLGYGRTWCLNAQAKIATISAGYADGLPLALTNRGFVFIGGRRCKIVGRISMDYTTVDVTDVPNVKAGDEVICFGKCGKDAITPDDWAALKGTHAYDIICSLGNRVVRVPVR